MILKRYPFLALLVPVLVFLISGALTQFPLPAAVYTGITYDLVLLAPALYFLAIRRTSLPAITVIPVMVAGILLAGLILPEHATSHYAVLRNVLIPLAEIIVLTIVGLLVYRTWKAAEQTAGTDLIQVLEQSMIKVIHYPRISKIMSIELGGLYYALFVWKKPRLSANRFSYQQTTGFIPILYALLGITAAETFIFHLLLARWSSAAAWSVTVLSIYGGLMILAQIKTMKHRPHVIGANTIELKNGIFGFASIDRNNIECIERFESHHVEEGSRLAFLGALEQQNLRIKLQSPVAMEGPYGTRKLVCEIRFHTDQPEKFIESAGFGPTIN